MQDGSAPLFIAAWHGHLDTVRALLLSDAEVNQETSTGTAPLFAAAMSGHSEIVKELLRSGVRRDQATEEGVTPLMAGHDDVVRSLLRSEAGAGNLRQDREMAVAVAMRHGHEAIVRLLQSVLVAGSLGCIACAACARHWRPPASPFDWSAVEAAERTVLVELARTAHRSAAGRPVARRAALERVEADAVDRTISGGSSSSTNSTSSSKSSVAVAGPGGPSPAATAMDGGQVEGPVAAADSAASLATPYLGQADALEERQPVVAYYCRVFAAGLILGAMKRGGWSQANEHALVSALEKAERAQPLLHLVRGKEELERCVLASMRVAEGAGAAAAFRDVALLLDVLEWFHGALTPDWEAVAEYARRRAAGLQEHGGGALSDR